MPKRIASLALLICLMAATLVPAFGSAANAVPFEVRDLYCKRYMNRDLTEAVVSHSGELTFYSDEACKTVIDPLDQRIYRDTQFWVREVRDGAPDRIRSFWAYVSNTAINFGADWVEGTRYVKLTIEIEDMPGMSHASGYVSLYHGDTFIRNVPLVWGEATYHWTAPSLADYTLRCVYKGDDYYDPYVAYLPVGLALMGD